MLTGDLPAAYMWNTVQTFLVKPWVKGFSTTPQDHFFPGDVTPLTISIQK
jgi:hypothetical protein